MVSYARFYFTFECGYPLFTQSRILRLNDFSLIFIRNPCGVFCIESLVIYASCKDGLLDNSVIRVAVILKITLLPFPCMFI